jgi:hypothetical protein
LFSGFVANRFDEKRKREEERGREREEELV